MAASGLVEDEIAQRLGVHKNVLRARHIDSIKAGKAAAAANEAEAEALTVAEYHVIDRITSSFASHWNDPEFGNMLWRGTDGRGARTIEDAYAAWKQSGGKFNLVGLSTRINKDKAAEFAKIAAEYRNRNKEV